MPAPAPLLNSTTGTMTVIELDRGALLALLDTLTDTGARTARLGVEVEPDALPTVDGWLAGTLKVSPDRGSWSRPLAAVYVRTSPLYSA